jgi:glycosyltransferase involved in cell wall biosynthesis
VKISWVNYGIEEVGSPGGAQQCQGRGYANICRRFREGLAAALGDDLRVTRVDRPEVWGDLALHVGPSDIFCPVPGARNVLFSMWEARALPEAYARNMMRADAWIVPSRYCQRVWHHHGIVASVVPLGISEAFLAGDAWRPPMPRTLRYLWLGSDQLRKGWQLIGPAWTAAFRGGEDVSLRLKCVGDGSVLSHFGGRVVIDRRDLGEEDLAALYLQHDVFLFPSYGEGFGLPVLEAAASGCLIVAPDSSSLRDFVRDDTAVVIPRTHRATIVASRDEAEEVTVHEVVHGVDDVTRALRMAYEGWADLEDRRMRAAWLARTFTWDAAIARLIDALDEIRLRPRKLARDWVFKAHRGERVRIVPRGVPA